MTVIPDSIEPIEEWRTWKFDGRALLSHNGAEWKAGEPFKATCAGSDRLQWSLVRSGWTLDQAKERARSHNERAAQMLAFSYGPTYSAPRYLTVPTVEPPVGYGYALDTVKHDAPDSGCSCGIYAGRTPDDCPSGDVLGKVKLWGTIVPGTKGARAEYGYPSELHVPAKLADHPALLAFGVPIVTVAEKDMPAAFTARPLPKWPLRLAVAANLGACAFNLGILALREIL